MTREETIVYLSLCAEEAKNKDWGAGIKFALEFIKDAIPKCRYNLSKDCNNRDCLNCVLDRIQAELLSREESIKVIRKDNNCFFTASEIIKIIDRYKAESEKT